MADLLARIRTGAARLQGQRHVPPERLGIIGALLAFVGIATMFAFQTPPFLAPDETAHVGYAHEIAAFDLPEIDQSPDVPTSATQWQAERASGADDRYRGVWVANHPPLQYALTTPLIWLSDATDRPDGGLMFMRLANILFAAVGVVMTYLLAKEVTGGARRIGLAAAGLAAFLPQGHGLFSEALNDGLAFAVGGAVTWAGARCLRHGATRHNLMILGAAAAAAFGARTATMLLAVAVVGFVAVCQLLQRRPWRDRVRSVAVTTAVGVGPGVVLFGWFYLRIIHLYGDIGASEFLLDYFRRTPRGGLFEIATWGHLWVGLYHTLLSPSPVFAVKAPRGTNVAIVVALVGLAIAVAVGRTGDRERGARGWPVSRLSMALGGLATVLIAITVAQHVSGGGNAYARYLFPVLPVLATSFAIGFDRLLPRLLPAASLGALAYWAWQNVPTTVDLASLRRPRDRGRGMPDVLRTIPSSATSRDFALGVAITGSAILAVVVLIGLFSGGGLLPEGVSRRLHRHRGGVTLGPETAIAPIGETREVGCRA